MYNAHLGTALLERRYQAPRLESWIHDRRVSGPKIVLGDFNEWARGLVADVLAERLKSIDLYPPPAPAADVSGLLPLLHLDHIYFNGEIEIRTIELARNRMALVASDHLPLVADIRVRFLARPIGSEFWFKFQPSEFTRFCSSFTARVAEP